MNKLTIPAILAATVMVAGMFAFMPVQQASTVHTTITDEILEIREITATDLNFGDGDVAIEIDGAAAGDRFQLLSLTLAEGDGTPASAGDDCVVDDVLVDGARILHTDSGDIDCGAGDTPTELLSEMQLQTGPHAGNLFVFELSDGTTQPEDTDDLNITAQVLIKDSAADPVITIE